MTTEIVNKIRDRRKNNKARKNSDIKVQINLIRRQIVKLSFQKDVNKTHRMQLLEELESLKMRLNQVTR